MKLNILLTSALILSGCGTIYTSPKVQQSDNSVLVVPISAENVIAANRSPYTPKRLPAAFSESGAQGVELRPLARLPDPAVKAEEHPGTPQISLPPPAAEMPYTIGISDVILLATPTPTGTDALTGLLAAQNKRQGYTVQDDGAIAVPDVGRIKLAGLNLDEAEAEVLQTLVEKQVDPTFSLEVAEFNSQKVSIGGAVKSPKLVPITLKPLLLQEALQRAGGLDVTSPEYTTIRLYRGGKIYQIPLPEFFAQPKLQKLRLTDGDSIFVDIDFRLARAQAYFQEQILLNQTRSSQRAEAVNEQRAAANTARETFMSRVKLGAISRDYVYLAGEVATQGRFPLPFESKANLADALYSEDGVANNRGDLGEIYVLRIADLNAPVTAYHLDASNVVNLLLATKMELRPNDVVFVSEQKVTAWNRVISQILPTFSLGNQFNN